ncbi:hypothetical protein BDV95DRAFT_602199 [Massariosphaeria phaeospora]|uniref:Uncharacterized protein n=1 Tax=Massariosphaeria phaeospora TaxID=100035 RepID=A0A7C8MIC6_9PLEO|nr:hypothetical protein BDV95DRAFT_602199 [Massariosphaeria phaeospora]
MDRTVFVAIYTLDRPISYWFRIKTSNAATNKATAKTAEPVKPRLLHGGYNPKIHDSYNPNADYAVLARQQEQEEGEAARAARDVGIGSYPKAYANRSPSNAFNASNAATNKATANTAEPVKPRLLHGGYNPKIHGSYNPNADYAVLARQQEEEEEAARAARAARAATVASRQQVSNDGYSVTARFNRFNGRFQDSYATFPSQ